jgi:hypothetical protein
MSLDKINRITLKVIAFLTMTFICGVGFLIAFNLDSKGNFGISEVSFWQSQLISFAILSMNYPIERLLNNLCYNKKKRNDK